MTPKQRETREIREKKLGHPPAGGALAACRQLLRRVARLYRDSPMSLRLATDEEQPLAGAVRSLRQEFDVNHQTISSRVWRETSGHPLWPVNHEHRLARHGKKNCTRETLAFSKTAAGLMDRALLYRVWRNNVKGLSERTPRQSKVTPAMQLGLTTRPLHAEEIFHQRLFPRRVDLPEELEDQYRGTVRSRPGEAASTYRYKTGIAA